MQIYDYNIYIDECKNKLDSIHTKLLPKFIEIEEINTKLAQDNVWSDLELNTRLNKTKSALDKLLNKFNDAKSIYTDFCTMIEMLADNNSAFTEDEVSKEQNKLNILIDELWIETLLNEKYDNNSALLTFHPGAGGEEAQDWAEMLCRMYLRYAERNNLSASILDKLNGDGAGIKSETILIEGDNAYGYLKTEKGVHRLVRISPFDANKRRHTSFASVEVSPYIVKDNTIEINSNDLKIDTYKSSGAGGQYVNKTESAIRITHIPTGIVVQCQNERSQIQNKEMALTMLKSKLLEKKLAEEEKEKQSKLSEYKKIEWGSQIRSYVLHPYNLVKDHRTNFGTSDTTAVLDGDIEKFIVEALKRNTL